MVGAMFKYLPVLDRWSFHGQWRSVFLVDRCSQFAWRNFHSVLHLIKAVLLSIVAKRPINVNICCFSVSSLTANVNFF